jgi:competence protein ComEA
VPRPRPDPLAAQARLAEIVPTPAAGGWVPPPFDPEPEPVISAGETDEVGSASVPPAGGDQGMLTGLVPVGLRGGRWDPGRRGVVALVGIATVAALVAGLVLLRSRPQVLTPPAAAGASSSPDAGAVVVVDVAGRVRHPGIVRLPFGARVDDAVRAAGGPLPGATYDGLNRARKLTDGEQVIVGAPPAGGAPQPGAAADARVDLNTADVSALDGLPGIGPVLAQKILDWRNEHGRFASVDQLREVSGIGESKFAALKSKVRI